MKPIRVNADYEIVLFENKLAPKVLNQSIEFLALYLEDAPLASSKVYSQEFLDHVEKISGNAPKIVPEKDFINWWGSLSNLPLERKLNSKELSANLSKSKIITKIEELDLDEREYLAKSPFGMSGQNIIRFSKSELQQVKSLLDKTGMLIIEPLFDRVYDFSNYIFPDGKKIRYQNIVDSKFQYKGTIISEKLQFLDEIDADEWKRFEQELERFISKLKFLGADQGYSIDSFVYRENGKLKIRTMCEINYRKTMGLITSMLSQKYGKEWNMLILGRSLQAKQRINLDGCIHLSPGDSRFEIFFITAENRDEGMKIFGELKRLLPDSQFTI